MNKRKITTNFIGREVFAITSRSRLIVTWMHHMIPFIYTHMHTMWVATHNLIELGPFLYCLLIAPLSATTLFPSGRGVSGSHTDFHLSTETNSMPYYTRLLSTLVSTQSFLFFSTLRHAKWRVHCMHGILVWQNRVRLILCMCVCCGCVWVCRRLDFYIFRLTFSVARFSVVLF